jgi:hypothetical protein
MLKPANDNKLTQAYLDFEADTDLFNWATMRDPRLVLGLKKMQGPDRERCVANFVWFFKFERSWSNHEAETKRSEIKVVK